MGGAASPPVVFYPTNPDGSKPVLHGGLCTANAARVYGIALGGGGSDQWSRMLRKKWATIAPTMNARRVPNHGYAMTNSFTEYPTGCVRRKGIKTSTAGTAITAPITTR